MTAIHIPMGVPMGIPVVEQAVAPDASVTKMGKPRVVPIVGDEDDELVLRNEHGYPLGLAKEMRASLVSSPLRFWIVDNSYSMQACDGQRAVKLRGSTRMISSRRTDELKDAVLHQAQLSEVLAARTDFHHLNRPPASAVNAPKCVTISSGHDGTGCPHAGTAVQTATDACQLLSNSIEPCGSTPLTEAIRHVHELIAPVSGRLRNDGQRAVVVIATDGLPDDPASFLAALQRLQHACPVWVVVRLCTSDDSITRYWTELDKQLESPLEVLDDVFGEAAEVGEHNPWLAYAPQLHAARLFGLQHKLFDLIDEGPLPPSAIKQFCELLLGCPPLPEPELEPKRFLSALRAALAPLPPVFDARRRQMRPWIDVDCLARLLSPRTGLAAILAPCLGAV